MSRYYDRAGKPISLADWCTAFEDPTKKRVAFDKVGDVEVSTVWLGLDHSWNSETILIFETMVFGGALNDECERYSTEAEAIAGHAAMLARVIALQGAS